MKANLWASVAFFVGIVGPAAAEERPVPLLTLKGHDEPVLRIVYSPDGKLLATASADNTAAIWEAGTGKRLITLKGHSRSVYDLAFSGDEKRLTTLGMDLTAIVWDVASGRNVASVKGPACWSIATAINPDGTHIAAASSCPVHHSQEPNVEEDVEV